MDAFELLAACAGSWRGANTLHDPHSGRPEESPSTLQVTPVLAGRFVRLDYTWSYQGKPQEGSLLVGSDPKTGEISGHWIDAWHNDRKVVACLGASPDGRTLSVRGSYAAPPGPDWGWRIEITPGEPGRLRIAHLNVDPGGNEEPAAEGVYSRA